MFGPGARVGVAVSGGADSVCLLHVLCELQPIWNLDIGIVHLNHQLRGEESESDEQFVRGLGRPVHVERVSLRDGNIEEAGREARHALFRKLIEDGTFHCIATGHNASDQAETVLFRLLRGTYVTGLGGIRPVTPDGIVRPLLEVSRTEILAYLNERGIPWREDSTNRSHFFARNRIRHHLLPALTTEWNPQLPAILARHAGLAREDEEFWSSEIGRLAPDWLTESRFGTILRLPLPHPAIGRRLIREAIRRQKGDLRQIDFRHVDAVLGICDASVGGHARVQIPAVDVMRSFDQVRFARLDAAPQVVETPNIDTLDWDKVRALGTAAEIRGWRPGDRYRRPGHSNEQKIKELFNEFRVPLWERRTWPLLCSGDRILWAYRFGPAAEFAAGDA